MRKATEIRADIEAGRERIDNILKICERENRELSAAEKSEVDAWLGDDKQPGRQAEMIEALSRTERIEAEHKATIREKLGPRLSAQMRDNGSAPSPIAMRDANGQRVYALDRGQRVQDVHPSSCPYALGELIRCMATGSARHAPEPIQNFMSSTDNVKGGFAVAPPELSSEIIDLARAQSVIMRLGTRTVPMQTGEMTFARITADPAIQVKAENDAFVEREVSFGQMTLSAYTIGTLVTCSRELAEDAPNFAEIISATIAKALAVELDRYTLQGDGSVEPLGLVNDPGIDDTGTTSVGALEYTDLANACEAIRVRNHEPSGIVLHPSAHSDVLLTTAGDGTTSERIWLAKAPTLEGVNMLATTNIPLAKGIVGDFSKLIWGIRTSATVEADTSGTRFDRHQLGFKIWFRGDFGITDVNAFHLLSGITS